MIGISLSNSERSAMAALEGTPVQGVLVRWLESLDRSNRAQKDDVQMRWNQGRTLALEDLLSEITKQARGDAL